MHKHSTDIFKYPLSLLRVQGLDILLFQIGIEAVRFSGYADIISQGTQYIYDEKQYKIMGRQKKYDLQRILDQKKYHLVDLSDIAELMGIDQCFFVNQKVGQHRICQIHQIDQYKMIHLRLMPDEYIHKWDDRQPPC